MDVDITILGRKNSDSSKVLDNIEFEASAMCDDIMAEIECEMGSMPFNEEDDGSVDETGSVGSNCVTISFVVGIR